MPSRHRPVLSRRNRWSHLDLLPRQRPLAHLSVDRHSMADDRHRHDRPQQNHPEDKHHQPSSRFPPGPPPSAEEHHQSRRSAEAPRPSMAAAVTLPSIHEARPPAGYGSQAPPPPPPGGRSYAHDPRYAASPNAVNGYPPPSAGQQPPSTYLPPLQTNPGDPRSPAYPPPDQRGYYDDRRPPPGQYPPDPHQPHHPPQQYAGEGYYYRGPPPGAVPPNGYARPPQGAYQEYAQAAGGAPGMAQAAPRQRTSIACRYCRKRKVGSALRCSQKGCCRASWLTCLSRSGAAATRTRQAESARTVPG